ncbi:MAG: 3-oxoacyl-ACP reductase FabG [Gammaproteobacteria bacterium]
MNIDLTEQTALVTGARRGIGRAIARGLGHSGAAVIGTATTEEGAGRLQEELAEEGVQATGRVLNVTDPASLERLAKYLAEAGLAPTILVNNAGITRDNLMLRMKDEEWEQVINTDLNSIYRVSKICLRGMVKARYGRIINITSVVALSGNAGQTNYAAAKAGIIGFTRSLAKEVGSRGVTVNAVAPGFIRTDMTENLDKDQKQMLQQQIALGRLGEAVEVANAVVFLASLEAAYISGETINVNGGMYMA